MGIHISQIVGSEGGTIHFAWMGTCAKARGTGHGSNKWYAGVVVQRPSGLFDGLCAGGPLGRVSLYPQKVGAKTLEEARAAVEAQIKKKKREYADNPAYLEGYAGEITCLERKEKTAGDELIAVGRLDGHAGVVNARASNPDSLVMVLYDLPAFQGRDLTADGERLPYIERRRLLDQVVEEMKCCWLLESRPEETFPYRVAPMVRRNKREFHERIKAAGGEGTMAKNLQGLYHQGEAGRRKTCAMEWKLKQAQPRRQQPEEKRERIQLEGTPDQPNSKHVEIITHPHTFPYIGVRVDATFVEIDPNGGRTQRKLTGDASLLQIVAQHLSRMLNQER